MGHICSPHQAYKEFNRTADGLIDVNYLFNGQSSSSQLSDECDSRNSAGELSAMMIKEMNQ